MRATCVSSSALSFSGALIFIAFVFRSCHKFGVHFSPLVGGVLVVLFFVLSISFLINYWFKNNFLLLLHYVFLFYLYVFKKLRLFYTLHSVYEVCHNVCNTQKENDGDLIKYIYCINDQRDEAAHLSESMISGHFSI